MLPEGPPNLLIFGQVAQACDDVLDLWDERLLERWREGHRRVRGSDPLHRRIEVLERLLGDRRGDLAAEASGVSVLVQDEHLRGLPHRFEHRLLVPWHERAQIEDLDRDSVAVELLRRLLGGVDHRAPGDHAQIAALPVDARLAEWRLVALVRYLGLDSPVEVLVLEV